MREIKFRAKRIDDGRWVYGQYFKTPLTDENSGTKPEDGWFFLCGEERHCIVQDCVSFVIDINTLGQYVLKDSQGKDVYEGDIVLITTFAGEDKTPYYGVFEWYESAFQIKGPKGKHPFFNDYVPVVSSMGMLCGFEVVGNRHENKEMLNAQFETIVTKEMDK